MTFSIGDLKFKDSCQFLAENLETLVKGLKTDGEDKYENLHNMKKEFKTQRQLELICQKGVYPYEWVDGDDKFKHEGLPPRKDFYSKLKLEGITKEEYKHAQEVYKEFDCKTFQDYHDLYLKTDVVLLADVFEHFISQASIITGWTRRTSSQRRASPGLQCF